MRAFVFVLAAMLTACGLEVEGLLDGEGGAADARHAMPSADATSSDAPPPDDAPAPEAPSPVGEGGMADAPRDSPPESTPKDAIEEKPEPHESGTGSDAGPDGGIVITGGSYTLLSPETEQCSMSGTTATSFTLYNDRVASVDLDWISYTCTEVNYGTLTPGGTQDQGTYVTHVWRVRDTSTKTALYEFVLNAAGTYTVTVH
jgi:hypothetical protein